MDNNLFEGAAAIWAALDDLVEKDPEHYRQFIESTLAQGPPLSNKGAGAGSDKKSQPQSARAYRTSSHEDADLVSLFAKLNPGKPEKAQKSEPYQKGDVSKSEKQEATSAGKKTGASSLLDNELGKSSIIASIVPKTLRDDVDDHGDHLSEDVHPISVAIPNPSKDKTTEKSKPLIEEI